MNIKRYLSARAFALLAAFALFGLVCVNRLFQVSEMHPKTGVTLPQVLVYLGVLLSLMAAAFFGLVTPYRRLRHIQRMFVSEQIYDELLHHDIFLSPEDEKMIGHFNHLLGKQDVIEMSKKQAEYLALQNQINPHFLYNTLEAIRGDALSEGALGIAQTTEALSTFFRYTITETGNLVTIEDELENVDNYFTIQQYRFGDRLKMEVIIADDDESLKLCQIPKLTLQPIIENAIYHGLENKAEGGKVTVRLETTEKRVLINISDNGVGIESEQVSMINHRLEKVALSYIRDEKKRRGGIALRNVAQRIKLLFGEEYGIQLYSILGMGTEVRINLPKLRLSEGANEL